MVKKSPKETKPYKAIDRRHRQFINALIKNNMVQKAAYLEVYPDCTPETAESASSALMAKPEMQEALQERLEELAIKDLVTIEAVLLRLHKRATTAKRDADGNRADELLGKYLAMFGSDGTNIQVNVVDKSDIEEIRGKLGSRTKNKPLPVQSDTQANQTPVIGSNAKLEAYDGEGNNDGTSVQGDVN